MKKIFFATLLVPLLFTACKKDEGISDADFNTLQTNVINDFVNNIALPQYLVLKTKAATLNTAVNTLNTTTTEGNLTAAKNAWKDLRTTWEQSEGFLFGPIEDNEYDPDTDSWPVNFNDLDALLTGSTTLTDVESFDRSLKGFHPLEYILWGQTGTKTAASLTARQKTYMVSLAAHINNKMSALYNNWVSTGDNYAAKVLTAGAGSTVYVKKQDLFTSIATGITDICGEVGDGKMKEPFDTAAIVSAARGAQIVESPFSGNSIIDFKNNIIGAYNVYLGVGTSDGHGLNEIVSAKNISLDNKIKQQFTAAIGSFDNITLPFEQAINPTGGQRIQLQNTMDAINTVSATIEDELKPFIIQYIKD